MTAALIFPGFESPIVPTGIEGLEDPVLLEPLARRGVTKFIPSSVAGDGE